MYVNKNVYKHLIKYLASNKYLALNKILQFVIVPYDLSMSLRDTFIMISTNILSLFWKKKNLFYFPIVTLLTVLMLTNNIINLPADFRLRTIG